MAEGSSLINLGELSKPATVLVEKVCNAVGIIYEPTRIKRQARAEAEADRIKALAQIELHDIERRAVERLVHQEARKQENIESITAQAANLLAPEAKVESLDEDWVAHFFKHCDTVSNKEMQSLWARLLSGEASNPGRFSKKTVDLVSTLERRDAELFTAFGQFVWFVNSLCPLIYDATNPIYERYGITFESLTHLDAIGLISFEPLAGYSVKGLEKHTLLFYYGRPLLLEFPADSGNRLEIGHAILTNAGRELVAICGSTRNDEYCEYVIGQWVQKGIIVASPMPLKASS